MAFKNFGEIAHPYVIAELVNIVLYFFVLGLPLARLGAHAQILLHILYNTVYCSI